MSTIFRNELSCDIPLELIDEIISWNEDDIAFLRSVSLVSKAWRAVALRYLFSEASFLCKHDFVRWGLIGASLPHVAQYVRSVVVDLGALWRLRRRATSTPHGLIARARSTVKYDPGNPSAYRSLMLSALDCTFPKDSEFDVILPIMSHATILTWTTPSTKEGFDPTIANVTRFLQSFPNITQLFYHSHLFRPEVQEHFMSFFHHLRRCEFPLWRRSKSEHVYVFPDHGSKINVCQLEELWFEECDTGSMDWLVDDVLLHSPSRIRKIGWEYGDPPFSPKNFARLLLIVHETLEELCFRPPWFTDDLEDEKAPPFNLPTLPVLQILSFKVLHISTESLRIMSWLDSIFAVFPSCPCLQRLEFSFHLTETRHADNMFASHSIDWNWLLQVRYPSLKVLEFEMSVDYEEDFGDTERKRVERLVRQSTKMVDCEKFVIRWI